MKILEAIFSFYLRLAEMLIRVGFQIMGTIISALVRMITAWFAQRNINKQAPGNPRRPRQKNRGRQKWQKKRR